jgi:hypothetical protein
MRRLSDRTIAVLMLIAASALPFYGQETSRPHPAQVPPSDQTTHDISSAASTEEAKTIPELQDPQTGPKKSNGNSFVFPTKRERFNRYVKSTVGPSSLLYAGASAGINQWRDNPAEWEQGASGYGRRYASSFGQNAIQQTVTYGLESV